MKELIVPAGMLAMLAAIVLPVPASLLDFALVANLLVAGILLVSALYIGDPLRLSALPTIVLLGTLARIALNIATTRLILSGDNSGRVIEAFGIVMAAGNLLVGVTIFLVLTIVQFVIVAKGAERVAEVAARFTLDALPGKQMAIDADVRAGLIDLEMARQKRQELQIESRFYGALDGAMKFVKGDAIAGLSIVGINIVGGLMAGLMIEGRSIRDAATRYTILTIGDGLVSQIPALLNALTAALVVTRVARGDGAPLARELIEQTGQIPRARILVGALAVGLAAVPKLPFLPFAVLGSGLLLLARKGSRAVIPIPVANVTRFSPRPPAPLELLASPKIASAMGATGEFGARLEQWRHGLFQQLGLVLVLPEIVVRVDHEAAVIVNLRGIATAKTLDIEPGADGLERIMESLTAVVVENAAELVDDQMTRRALDFLDRHAPELVAAVIPGVMTVTHLTETLRALVKERVSIRHLDVILQGIAESGLAAHADTPVLEEVRIRMARVISHTFADVNCVIRAVTVDPLIDLAFSRVARGRGAPNIRWVDVVSEYLRGEAEVQQPIIVSRYARVLLRDVLRMRGIENSVLAHEEIADGFRLESCGHVVVADEMARDQNIEELAA